MSRRNFTRFPVLNVTLMWLVVAAMPLTANAQGILLPAGGAVNRGMGGATTGTAIEAIGSMYFNPATINRLPTSELAFGFETIFANYSVASTFPGLGTGYSEGDVGAVPVPTIAWVHHTNNPNVTLGLGMFGVGGFATNIRADPTNPILSPPFAQGGAGLGGIKSEAIFFQLTPAISLQVTERLSVAAGPVIGMGKIMLDDNIFVGANANGAYPRGDGTGYHWGFGAQVGVHYVHNCCWEFGANVKTPTWFESFRYFSEDALGQGRTDKVGVSLPMVLNGGLAYKGFEYAVLTADLRYLNYNTAKTLGDSPSYQADGRVTGLGWNDQFSVAVGAQLQLTERLIGRLGYMFTSDLIDSSDTFFNVGSDLSYNHTPTVGASYQLSENATLSAAYNYVFSWGDTGPYVLPGVGPVQGSSITTKTDAHIATVGVNVRY